MYAIKQIKICAEYRDMLPRPRLDLSGTPGLRPIGLSPGSWQTSLGLGSMSRYSAQILICITIQLELTCYHCMVASSRGDCPFVALRSTDMTTVRRVWHGLGCEQCNPRNVMILTHWDRVTHICVLASMVQIMACRLVGAKPLSKPKLEYC